MAGFCSLENGMIEDLVALIGLGMTLVGSCRAATFLGRTECDVIEDSYAIWGSSDKAVQAKSPRVQAKIRENQRLKQSFWWIAAGTVLQIIALPLSWWLF